jgi:hypothetical protein
MPKKCGSSLPGILRVIVIEVTFYISRRIDGCLCNDVLEGGGKKRYESETKLGSCVAEFAYSIWQLPLLQVIKGVLSV